MYCRVFLLYVCACAERGGSLWNKVILGRYYCMVSVVAMDIIHG